MARWFESHEADAERAAQWAGSVLVSAFCAWAARWVRNQVAKRSQQDMVAKEILGENPNNNEKLRDIVEGVRSTVVTNTALREQHERNTEERFREIRGDLQNIRQEMNHQISGLRSEQTAREERQERRIDGFLDEIRTLTLHHQEKVTTP